MTNTEKLKRIATKCRQNIAYAESNITDLYGGRAIAGWRSTIAAIEFIERGEYFESRVADEIAAAWPDELLCFNGAAPGGARNSCIYVEMPALHNQI